MKTVNECIPHEMRTTLHQVIEHLTRLEDQLQQHDPYQALYDLKSCTQHYRNRVEFMLEMNAEKDDPL